MDNMEYLIYTSKVSSEFKYEDIATILVAAYRNNQSLELTGAIVFHNGRFMQYLEGPRQSLDNLMAKIKADSRHLDINIQCRDTIQNRRFASWSMQQLDDDYVDDYESEHNGRTLKLEQLTPNVCLLFFTQAVA